MNNQQKTIGNTKFFKPKWVDKPDINKFIKRELIEGDVLCFPSGKSDIGDIRADIDSSVEPDVLADLMNPPFEHNSFDTVYCDPPYSFFAYDKIYSWVHELWHIARDRLVLQTRNEAIRLKNAERTVYYAEDTHQSMQYLVLQVFDRTDNRLGDYE